MKALLRKACQINRMLESATGHLEPLVLLGIRLWMGEIFLRSGANKLIDYLNGNGENVIDLFEYVHPVPMLPAEIAAPLSMASEVTLGTLFVLGMLGRWPALGLVVVTGMIQLAMPQMHIHGLWTLLLLVVVVRGPGPLALDFWLKPFMCKG